MDCSKVEGDVLVDIERSNLSRITQIIPLKRTQERVKFDDGREVVRCYGPHNPHYFKDGQGNLNPIQIGQITSSSSAIGDVYLRSQNVVSVGFRQDANPEKYLGLRPDFNQATGEEQLEFSLESVKIDGRAQVCDLSKNQIISPIRVDLGGMIIQSTRQYTRQMVKTSGEVNDFQVEFKIHLKDLKIEHRVDLDEYWIYSDKGEFRFRIVKPCLIDPVTMRPIHWTFDENGNPLEPLDLVSHDLIDNGDGTYTYIKTPAPDFGRIELPEGFLIDAEIVYSETSDAWVRHQDPGETWQTVRNAATGIAVDTNDHDGPIGVVSEFGGNYTYDRSFFMFDLSVLSGTVSAVSLNIYGVNNAQTSVSAQHGTQGDIVTVEDYDAFDGNEYAHVAWALAQYNVFEFNEQGESDISDALGGTAYICCREYTKDYLNVEPGANQYNDGYFSDEEGTDYDPYLEITLEEGVSIPVFMHHYQQMMRT